MARRVLMAGSLDFLDALQAVYDEINNIKWLLEANVQDAPVHVYIYKEQQWDPRDYSPGTVIHIVDSDYYPSRITGSYYIDARQFFTQDEAWRRPVADSTVYVQTQPQHLEQWSAPRATSHFSAHNLPPTIGEQWVKPITQSWLQQFWPGQLANEAWAKPSTNSTLTIIN